MAYSVAKLKGLGLDKGFHVLLLWVLVAHQVWPSRLFLESTPLRSGKDHLRQALPSKILGHFCGRRTNKMQTHIYKTVSALGKISKCETESSHGGGLEVGFNLSCLVSLRATIKQSNSEWEGSLLEIRLL